MISASSAGQYPQCLASATSSRALATTDYRAYVSSIEKRGYEFDTTSGKRLGGITLRDSIGSTVLDSPSGIAATPDGSQVFVADEGKSSVLAINTATNKSTQIELGGNPPPGTTTTPIPANVLSGGGFPQDVAVSSDSSTVYATVTGPLNRPRRPAPARGHQHRRRQAHSREPRPQSRRPQDLAIRTASPSSRPAGTPQGAIDAAPIGFASKPDWPARAPPGPQGSGGAPEHHVADLARLGPGLG